MKCCYAVSIVVCLLLSLYISATVCSNQKHSDSSSKKQSSKSSTSSSKGASSGSSSGSGSKKNNEIVKVGNSVVSSVEKHFDAKRVSFDNIDGSAAYLRDVFDKVFKDIENNHNTTAKLRANCSKETQQAFERILENLTIIMKDDLIQNATHDDSNVNAAREVFELVKRKILKR